MIMTDRDYGLGGNFRLLFSVSNPKWGTFTSNFFLYELFILPYNIPNSEGRTFFSFIDVSYSYPLSEHLTLAIGDTMTLKRDYHPNAYDLKSWTNVVRLYAQWVLVKKDPRDRF
jgi:hypothetical protein